MPFLPAALLLLAGAAAGLPDEVRRGAQAVGERTSDQPALRTGPPPPGAGFRLGAAYRAWRNAAAAVRFDATHTTGDGGDAEALAVDCGDERIAFASLEAALPAAGIAEAAAARAAGEAEATAPAEWRARRSARPAPCH